MEKYLIKNAQLVTENAQLGNRQRGDILIEDGRIAAIGAQLYADDAEQIDATGMLALPGFVDAHRHNWESLLRCTGVDWTLTQYFTAVKKVLGPAYTAEDIYLASYLGGVECVNCGITTLADWFHNNNSPAYADAAVQGLTDAGVRFVFGFSNSIAGELPVSSVPMDAADLRRVQQRYFSSHSLGSLALATRGPQFETAELALQEIRLAQELGLLVFMHVGDGSWGKNRAVQKLHNSGVLNNRFTFIHCNMLFDEEIDMIGHAGAGAVSCPEVELNMGHGYLRTVQQRRAGIELGLGVDVVTSVPGDMFGTMRYMLAGVRAVANERSLAEDKAADELPLKATDVLHYATLGGATVCGLGELVGSLTPGKRADIVLLDSDEPNMFPVNSPVGAIVEAAHPGNVDTVFIDGKLKKRNKQLLGVDRKALKRRVNTACETLFSRSGIQNIETWVPAIYGEKPPDA